MDPRIHDCLDGDGRGDDLTLEQRDELARLEATIGAVAGPLRSAAVPDLTEAVMARVAQMRPAPSARDRSAAALRRVAGWLLTPRPVTVRLRPAYTLGAVALVALAIGLLPRSGPPIDGVVPYTQGGELPVGEVYVQFRVDVDGASHVALAGSFTGWRPDFELSETMPGTWSILIPLQPGIHDYAFVVDGEHWLTDPHAFQIDDGFGGTNSRIALPAALPDAAT
jgi:hypothetical protein